MSKFIPYPFYHDDVPIDISFVFENEKPAGKHGFLKTEGRDFVFEDGTKVKFWGTNFNGCGCFPEHDYAEKLAKRLAKIGINLVRFHQLDSQWHTPNIFSFTKGKRVTEGKLCPESMDRLDYLIYCLKKEGIYCYMDMFTYRKFRSDEGVENAHALADAAKCSCIFNRRLIDLQKEVCHDIWTHHNPYTNLAYCDDPAFVLAEIVNESCLFSTNQYPLPEPYKSEFLGKLDEWLNEKKINKTSADFDLTDFKDETLIDFKIELQEKYYREMYDYMRACGVKIPITGANWTITPANYKTQMMTDFLDNHPYAYDWRWGAIEKHCQNSAVTNSPYSYLAEGAFSAAADKPTYVSEWDMPWPNEFRAESPIYSAALGVYQGWSGFAIHTYSYTCALERMQMLGKEICADMVGNVPYRAGVFSTWNDPAKFGLFYHAALITRRGDVSLAKSFKTINQVSKSEWNWEEARANIEKCGVLSDYSFRERAQEKGINPDDEILSDTGELYINRKKNFGYINTPKTKCAYGFLAKNGQIDLDDVKIQCETDFAVIALSTLEGESISSSPNMLLTTVGRAENTGFKMEGDLTLDIGKPPVNVEVIKAEIEIKTDCDGLSVWAISPEGFYIGTVPATYENGILRFKLGEVAHSMYYLIVKD